MKVNYKDPFRKKVTHSNKPKPFTRDEWYDKQTSKWNKYLNKELKKLNDIH